MRTTAQLVQQELFELGYETRYIDVSDMVQVFNVAGGTFCLWAPGDEDDWVASFTPHAHSGLSRYRYELGWPAGSHDAFGIARTFVDQLLN